MRTPIRVTAAAAVAAAAMTTAATPAFASASNPASARQWPRRVRADRQHGRQSRRGLPAGGRRHLDPGRQLRYRRPRRHPGRVRGRPHRVPGLADLRPAARPALRRERGQRHDLGLRRARRPAGAPRGAGLGRHVPGQRGRPRRPGLRAQRAERRLRPGLPGLRRLPGPAARLAPRARPRPERHPAVHHHARAGRLHPGRVPAHRHDQGQRQRHRRVRRRLRRAAVRPCDRQQRARDRSVRDLLRPVRPSGDRRGRDQRAGHLRPQPQRHGQPARPGRPPGRPRPAG